MQTIAVINQKGGCGKTTISINLSAALAKAGHKTLLVDMDPQGHCALGLAVPREQIERSTYDILREAEEGDGAKALRQTTWQIATNFDLAPATIKLAAFEQEFAGMQGREEKLAGVLSAVADQYDVCVVDCPPSVGLLTFNALMAADQVLVPVETGFFCLESLGQQLKTVELLKDEYKRDFRIRVVANLYDVRTRLAREVLGHLREKFGQILCRTTVNFNTKLKEAASLGQPINEYNTASAGYRDFRDLAREILTSRPAGIPMLDKQPEKTASDEPMVPSPFSAAQEVLDQAKQIGKSAEVLLDRANKVIPGGVRLLEGENRADSTEERLAKFYGVRQTQGGIVFRAHYPHAEKVGLAGDFNDWNTTQTPMVQAEPDRVWQIILPLEPGCYRYRLVVDERWQRDPFNDRVEANPFGELNSVIEVK